MKHEDVKSLANRIETILKDYEIQFSGEYRRHESDVSILSLVLKHDNSKEIEDLLEPHMDFIHKVGPINDHSFSLILADVQDQAIEVFVAHSDAIFEALSWFTTGSSAEIERLKKVAEEKGLSLDYDGLRDEEGQLLATHELGIYMGVGEPFKGPVERSYA